MAVINDDINGNMIVIFELPIVLTVILERKNIDSELKEVEEQKKHK